MGKLNSAHRAGAPTARERGSCTVGESDCLLATVAGPLTVLLHGGQSSISLEYQTYTSAHLFDTLVAGMNTTLRRGGIWNLAFKRH